MAAPVNWPPWAAADRPDALPDVHVGHDGRKPDGRLACLNCERAVPQARKAASGECRARRAWARRGPLRSPAPRALEPVMTWMSAAMDRDDDAGMLGYGFGHVGDAAFLMNAASAPPMAVTMMGMAEERRADPPSRS